MAHGQVNGHVTIDVTWPWRSRSPTAHDIRLVSMEHLQETTSCQLGYFIGFVTIIWIVQFGKKTANIKCKNFSVYNTV